MGEVIRKSASAVDIFADVRATLANARAKGGTWKDRAEARLGPVAAAIDSIEARVAESEAAVVPLQAAVEAKSTDANELLGRVSDEIWNAAGRPRSDPGLTMLFPGGLAYYTTGAIEEQPRRMDLLAELLESGLHARVPAERAATYASQIRASATELRAVLEAASGPHARLQLLDRVRRTVATGAQAELANLKRLYKAERFSEADIHAVIPARPAAGKRPAAATAPSPAPTPEPAPPAAPPVAPPAPAPMAEGPSNGV